jgi:hypothetical protein
MGDRLEYGLARSLASLPRLQLVITLYTPFCINLGEGGIVFLGNGIGLWMPR